MLPPSLSLSLFFSKKGIPSSNVSLQAVPRLAKPFISSANRTYYASTSLNPLRIFFMILYY